MDNYMNIGKNKCEDNIFIKYTENPKNLIGWTTETKIEGKCGNESKFRVGILNLDRSSEMNRYISLGAINVFNNGGPCELGLVNIIGKARSLTTGKINFVGISEKGFICGTRFNYIGIAGERSTTGALSLINFVISAKNAVMIGLINVNFESEKCYQIGLLNVDLSANGWRKLIPLFAARNGKLKEETIRYIEEKKQKNLIDVSDMESIKKSIIKRKIESATKKAERNPSKRDEIKRKLLEDIEKIKNETSLIKIVARMIWSEIYSY
ncbi:MAG: hypothetical protein N3G74_01135 [Candidatus Micrarchaeota archaeon]|nr:hypothetical protein [Candidatus Micrarchaeota archaeon]